MDVPVFIHTRDRLGFLRKTIPAWTQHSDIGRIILVIEKDEYFATRRQLKELGYWDRVEVIRLAQVNAGMGNARKQALRWAAAQGFTSMVMSDDDITPRANSDINAWLKFAESGETVGVGVCMPIYGLTLGNDFIRDTCEPVRVSGAWGFGVFALNIPLAMEIGGFDSRLVCGWEDGELCRQGIAHKQLYWHVHTGVVGTNLGKRYAPGGISSLFTPEEREAREKACHKIIYDRWGPRYISDLSKKFRCNWRRFFMDHGMESPSARRREVS